MDSKYIHRNKNWDGLGKVLDASFTKEEIEQLFRKLKIRNYKIKTSLTKLEIVIYS